MFVSVTVLNNNMIEFDLQAFFFCGELKAGRSLCFIYVRAWMIPFCTLFNTIFTKKFFLCLQEPDFS